MSNNTWLSSISIRIVPWLMLLVVVGLCACRTHKPVAVTETVPESTFYTSCYPVESISIPKCKLNITEGSKSNQLSGSIYIHRDSVCYFRGVLLVEVLRGVIYRDSFAVINRIDRICFKGKNDYLSKFAGYPVNPESLFMLFTADRCEAIYTEKLGFRITAENDRKIVMESNLNLLEMNISDNHTMEHIALYGPGQKQAKFSTTYKQYNQCQQFMMPTVLDIFAHDGKNSIKINAGFQEVSFNQSQKINFSVPAGYKVVTLQ